MSDTDSKTLDRFRRQRRWASILWPAFLVWTAVVIGLRGEHVAFAVFFWACASYSPKTARFGAMTVPLALTGAAYDYLPLFLPFRGDVHVSDLYQAEVVLFGFEWAGKSWIPSQFLTQHPTTFLDAITGFAYLAYLLETIIFGALLYFMKKETKLRQFAWSFALINLLGMTTWVLYPAAPPWYVDIHGLGPAVMDAAPSAAGAARFDALFGISVFQSFYSRNLNVFGAMPSLHTGYPTVVACIAFSLSGWLRWTTISFAILVGFSAVYLNHHYVLDVMFGVLYALASVYIAGQIVRIQRKSIEAPPA
jgi:inositol phosphorylceramide synthase catalytic subunit